MTFVRFVNYLMKVASRNHDPSDVESLLHEITLGEGRGVSGARVASIHFPVLRYYSLFVGRCLIGRGESGGLSAPDFAILRLALHRDRTYSLGTMVAKRLSLNRFKGSYFRSYLCLLPY